MIELIVVASVLAVIWLIFEAVCLRFTLKFTCCNCGHKNQMAKPRISAKLWNFYNGTANEEYVFFCHRCGHLNGRG